MTEITRLRIEHLQFVNDLYRSFLESTPLPRKHTLVMEYRLEIRLNNTEIAKLKQRGEADD